MDVATFGSGLRIVASSADHPRLTNTDSEHIRSFPRDQSQYAFEVEERPKQVACINFTSTEGKKPV